jgi:hypothetical protein
MNCEKCGTSLNEKYAVLRTYIDKDNKPDVKGLGHYDNEGDFNPDQKIDLSFGRYDLHDGSDTCAHCGNTVG